LIMRGQLSFVVYRVCPSSFYLLTLENQTSSRNQHRLSDVRMSSICMVFLLFSYQ
jgi:hypothetical protein